MLRRITRAVATGARPLAASLALSAALLAQELPHSGSFGLSFVYATSPGGSSQLLKLQPAVALNVQPYGAAVNAVPSRWSHQRRTLSALEPSIAWDAPLIFMTAMGDAPGNGAIHLVDGRGSPLSPSSTLHATGNPACYDLAVFPALKLVLAAEDTGLGTTRLRGFSYATPHTLVPTTPAFVDVAGAPAAYVNRMGVDTGTALLHVPTAAGVGVLQLSAGAPQLVLSTFATSGVSSPTTNPVKFDRNGTPTWIVGTAQLPAGVGLEPLQSGFLAWTAAGASESASFGTVTSNPAKKWVPAIGCEELAVCSNGVDAYAYDLLREPKPGTFFVKGSAVGVVKFAGSAAAVVGTLALSNEAGEPFSIPAVHGLRVAFETSFGPPFVSSPADGGERLVVIYSPLDPLGGNNLGKVAVPAPLNGRINAQGMDRPIWSHDGSRLFASTSWFPGESQVGLAGLEALAVPAAVLLNSFVAPHVVVPTPSKPDQSVGFGTLFDPADPLAAGLFAGLSACGNLNSDGPASALAASFGEIGQKQPLAPKIDVPSGLPGFRSILPASFDDANGSLVAVPPNFGARRSAFDLVPGHGLYGLILYGSTEDRILLQPTGWNMVAALGLVPELGFLELPLPPGWITTTEFFSL